MAEEKVLIIDDSDALRSLLESILPYAGYNTVSAGTGRQGLQLVAEVNPDVILTDLELPDTSGLKVLEELNEQGINIPTIMMTGYGSEGIAARALQLGVRDYLIKPFTTEEVLASIERALSESRLRRENAKLAGLVNRYTRHFRVISALGRALASDQDLGDQLQRIAEAGRFVTKAEVALVLLLDGASDQLEVVAANGQVHSMGACFSPHAGDERLYPVLENEVPVRCESVSGTKIQIQTGEGVNAVLQVPLRAWGSVCGLISVDRRVRSAVFGKLDELLLLILSDYACVALERSRRAPGDTSHKMDSALETDLQG
jgi:two-component system NtrC family sensor kinase